MAGLNELYTTGTIDEVAKKLGCSPTEARQDIRKKGVDRRYEQEYARWKIVNELRDHGDTYEEIRKNEKVREVFNGKTPAKGSISRYVKMTKADLEKKKNPNRLNPIFNEHNTGASKILAWSSGPTDKCLKEIFELHIKENYIDCDLTYSIGNFYNKTGLPQPKNKFDKYPKADLPDVHPLDEVDNLPDECFSSIIVDPPFVIRKQKEGVSNGITVDRFGSYDDYDDLVKSNKWLIATAGRLLKEGGILVYKIQDCVSSGRQRWTHALIEKFAAENHLEQIDMHLYQTRLLRGNKSMRARHSPSYILS